MLAVSLRTPRWHARLSLALKHRPSLRFYATAHDNSVEHIRVRCKSSGEITVTLHNMAKYPSTTPLMIFIPSFANQSSELRPQVALPPWLHEYPTAVINYRWQPLPPPPEEEVEQEDGVNDLTKEKNPRPHTLSWPTPINDILFGYTWLSENLVSPPFTEPAPCIDPSIASAIPSRPAYVYGSYLGASLAASLAITESHNLPNPGLNIRGLIAHNGIYNWTTFLPDHPINHPPKEPPSYHHQHHYYHRYRPYPPSRSRFKPTPSHPPNESSEPSPAFTYLSSQIPLLFPSPSSLFDPFISASCFFHSSPLHVPRDFFTPVDQIYKTGDPNAPLPDNLTTEDLLRALPPPRLGLLDYPPPYSTQRIPHALLIHDNDDNGTGRNGFESQANELAGYMRRSVYKREEGFKYNVNQDREQNKQREREHFEDKKKRVKLLGVKIKGGENASWGLDTRGEEEVRDWVGRLAMKGAELNGEEEEGGDQR
ncbi:hypothetical protein QBC44DRAFT_314242 [Cladorrhinum sp. PSN332]|nr:hypothetical protein QBC44DRAFT_314242 [Cladorrhinum sp. PSN332]